MILFFIIDIFSLDKFSSDKILALGPIPMSSSASCSALSFVEIEVKTLSIFIFLNPADSKTSLIYSGSLNAKGPGSFVTSGRTFSVYLVIISIPSTINSFSIIFVQQTKFREPFVCIEP